MLPLSAVRFIVAQVLHCTAERRNHQCQSVSPSVCQSVSWVHFTTQIEAAI